MLEPAAFHVSRSFARFLRRCRWTLTLDRDFAGVIDGCAAPRRGSGGTWITAEMRDAYLELAARGLAHSIEVWADDVPVGVSAET